MPYKPDVVHKSVNPSTGDRERQIPGGWLAWRYDTTLTKSNLGERVCLACRLQPIVLGVQDRSSNRSLEAGIETETVEESRLLACFFWLAQLPFLHSAGSPEQGWHHPLWARPYYTNLAIKKMPTDNAKTNLLEKIYQFSFLHPRRLLFV